MKRLFQNNTPRAWCLGLILFLVSGSVTVALGQVNGPKEKGCGEQAFFTYSPPFGISDCLSFTWLVTFPDGSTQSFGGPVGSSSISVNVGTTLGILRASVTATCRDTTGIFRPYFGFKDVTVVRRTLPRPTLTSSTNFLCNNSPTTFTIAPISGASSYRWEVPSGWRINGVLQTSLVTTNTSVQITAPATGIGAGSVRVRANGSGCTSTGSYRTQSVDYGRQPVQLFGPTEA
ncbi:MAG TPA: hypothetical protein DCP28_21940, partial [Cytophagales bacterium]|nr:hypothetical protein [Cytophagales bacterium]